MEHARRGKRPVSSVLAISSTLAVGLAMAVVPGSATGDTGGPSVGPVFERNVSDTPELESSKAKIDSFPFYVPARDAAGEGVPIEYTDARGRLVETRDEAKPLLSVYIEDAADAAAGDDVWAAYSLDDGNTWKRSNLSMVADRSSYTIDGKPYPGMVTKPALTLKGNRALVSWTSTYCQSGSPAYASSTQPDTYGVGGEQGSVDYALQGYPEVGQVPYECLWAARGRVDQTTGSITWYRPERLTSGVRYAMQMASNSAPSAGFVIAWAEDPAGLTPGEGSGPGGGWTGSNPHDGTDVWYSYLSMSGFDGAAASPATDPNDPDAITARPQPSVRFSVPVPVSDNGQLTPEDPLPSVGATRPAVNLSPYSFTKPDSSTGNSAWVAYGYEETKPGAEDTGDPEAGKQVFHHAFRIDTPDVRQPGVLVSDEGQSGRRVRYITQPVAQMGASRTIGLILYREGTEGHAGAADFLVRRFVVPAGDAATDNPFRAANMTGVTNVSATTELQRVPDPVTGDPRATRWTQTAANLHDAPSVSALESARGHRGMMKGDFLALGYLWTPNWGLFMQGRDIENYYVRRSFDGGATFTSAPSRAPYDGNGVTSCRYFSDPTSGALLAPVCSKVAAGAFEPAQNLSRMGGLQASAIEPRLFGLPGSIPASAGSGTEPGVPYPEDVQNPAVVWQAWGTGTPQSGGEDGDLEEDPDIPVPGADSGKSPLDIYYTFSQDYGDTYVQNDLVAGGPSAQGEVQLRFSPDGSRMSAVWDDSGPSGVGALDVFFRRFLPDRFAYNTTVGELDFGSSAISVREGDEVRIPVDRLEGWRGAVTVDYRTVDGTAKAGVAYRPVTGTVELGHGQGYDPTYVAVQTLEDSLANGNEQFRLVLGNATGGASVGARSSITVTIVDNDAPVPPQSRASTPTITHHRKIPVTYQVGDIDSTVTKVELFVKRPGSTAVRRAAVDTTLDGRFVYDTRGVDGTYRFYTVGVDPQGNVERAPRGFDSATVLDTDAPRVTQGRARPSAFDISRNGSVRLSFRLSQRATTTMTIRHHGIVVDRFPTVVSRGGTVTRSWDGRDATGQLVPEGWYRAVLRAVDPAGNVGVDHVTIHVTR